MPRIRLLASSLALAICTITAAHAQQFDNVVTFGDSLSDAGNFAHLAGLPAGNSFTTNPDSVAVQLVAKAFGFDQTDSLDGGSNYAVGGACLEADSATFECGPSNEAGLTHVSITEQVEGYLKAGGADPNSLYTMWGGANDLFTYADLAGAGAISGTQALIGSGTAAATEVGLVNALQAGGAKNVLLFNLPNIAVTPDAAAEATGAGEEAAAAVIAAGGTPAQAAAAAQAAGAQVIQALTGLSLEFNSTLNQGMAGKSGIIAVDVFGLVNEVLANPSAYGFSNTTGMACATGPGIGGTPSSVACGPSSAIGKLPYTYADGTNMTYFFADGVHPTGQGHQLLADYVLAEIAAPSYASMLAETPLQTFQTQNRTIHNQVESDMGSQRADGSFRTFASFDYSRQRFDQTSTSPQTTSDDSTLVMGSDYYVNSAISLGLSTTLSHQDANFSGGAGSFENNEPMVASWINWHSQDAYVSLLGSLGQLNFNGIDRVIHLLSDTRVETASTDGTHAGFQLEGGYFFHWDDLATGPFASISHQRVRVSGYSEFGDDSTAMTFGRQDRNSTISSVGWELKGDDKFMGGAFHPYARFAYEHESEADPRLVTAGLVTLNGTFSMPGFESDSSWWTGELGVAANLASNVSGYAAYDGHFGDSNEHVNSFNVGLKWAW